MMNGAALQNANPNIKRVTGPRVLDPNDWNDDVSRE